MNRWLSLSFLVASLGCSSSTVLAPGLGDGGAATDGGTDGPVATPDGGVPDDSAPPPDAGPIDNKTWTGIYAAYFGPGSLGHCGKSMCHGTSRRGFVCATKEDCYQSMVANKFIGTDAAVQVLVDPQASVLSWISGSGSMPADVPADQNDKATADLKVWIAAGALDN